MASQKIKRKAAHKQRAVMALIAIFILLLIVTLIWLWPTMKSYSETGAAYAARVTCSCHYIGGRTMEDCAKDMEPGIEIVTVEKVTEDDDGNPVKRITTKVPIFATDQADFIEGSGCVLQSWKEK